MRNNFQSSPVNEMNNPKVTAAAPAHSRTDEDLVAAAKRGDELALETLIKRYRPRIFAVALRYAGVHEDAEDIVQQTFQKVFVYLHNFQGKSSFSTWVTRIAINESLMLLRKSRGSREVSIEGSCSEDATSPGREIFNSSPNPEMSYLQREAGQILFSAIAQLKPKLRVVLELKELRELSGYDTARHIGVSLSAVKARVFHGRKKLRKLLRGSLRAPRVSGSSVSAIAANVKRMPQDRITRSA
jgi:RNA polymerase sigma-70 factor (ECF subfamily)